MSRIISSRAASICRAPAANLRPASVSCSGRLRTNSSAPTSASSFFMLSLSDCCDTNSLREAAEKLPSCSMVKKYCSAMKFKTGPLPADAPFCFIIASAAGKFKPPWRSASRARRRYSCAWRRLPRPVSSA